ncbi:MAG TPA: hypothetical protein VLC49_04455 [Solirubrobacteraceae bacterium]|nr:hypothetical protein [Solirubrobacteraceae bacterium]
MTSAILDPTGLTERPAADTLTLASRPANLSGVKIGLLENGKQNARRLLEDVADVLRERYGAGEAQLRRKEIFSQPAPPELVDELSRQAEVVVVGIGD